MRAKLFYLMFCFSFPFFIPLKCLLNTHKWHLQQKNNKTKTTLILSVFYLIIKNFFFIQKAYKVKLKNEK